MLVDAKAGMIAWAFDRDYLIPVAGIRREINPRIRPASTAPIVAAAIFPLNGIGIQAA